jgi:hypothetical protein
MSRRQGGYPKQGVCNLMTVETELSHRSSPSRLRTLVPSRAKQSRRDHDGPFSLASGLHNASS